MYQMTKRFQSLHVALLSGEYPPQPGGIGDYTRQLGEALVARGHRVQVFTIHDSQFTIYDLPDHNRQATGDRRQSDWGFRSWRAISVALAATRPDVLHIQYQTGAYGMHPAINLLPWWLRRQQQRPAIAVTMHDLLLPYLFPKAGPARRWVTQRLMRDADAVVVTNEEDYAQIADDRRLTTDERLRAHSSTPSSFPILIPIGSNIPVAPPADYDRAAWRARLLVHADETLVAYFGLLGRSKGVDVLVRALAQLPASVRLLLIGGEATAPQDRAYATEVEQLVEALGLHDRIVRTGHCAPAEVSAHLLAADMAALPFADGASFRRGSLLAALAHGVPVITTTEEGRTTNDERRTTNDGRWITDDGRTPHNLQSAINNLQSCVLLVPPSNPDALAAAIRRLMGDTALRARLGAAGRALAAQFAWGAIAEQHEALYQMIVKQSM
jgi:glycosyltransferase involved in cell wall biosynthesis